VGWPKIAGEFGKAKRSVGTGESRKMVESVVVVAAIDSIPNPESY